MSVRYLNATGTQALINEIKARLATKASSQSLDVLAMQLANVQNSIPTKVSELTNDSEFLTSAQAADTYYTKSAASELTNTIQEVTDEISILEGDATTEGSVDYKIQQALSGSGSLAFARAFTPYELNRVKGADIIVANTADSVPAAISVQMRDNTIKNFYLTENSSVILVRARSDLSYYYIVVELDVSDNAGRSGPFYSLRNMSLVIQENALIMRLYEPTVLTNGHNLGSITPLDGEPASISNAQIEALFE